MNIFFEIIKMFLTLGWILIVVFLHELAHYIYAKKKGIYKSWGFKCPWGFYIKPKRNQDTIAFYLAGFIFSFLSYPLYLSLVDLPLWFFFFMLILLSLADFYNVVRILKTKKLQINLSYTFIEISAIILFPFFIFLVPLSYALKWFPTTFENVIEFWSVIIMVEIFTLQRYEVITDKIERQKGLLKSLRERLEYLGGIKWMKIYKNKRKSHVHWIIENFNKSELHTHEILVMDADFFNAELDFIINNKPTYELKRGLYLIRDSSLMINYWTDYFYKQKKGIVSQQKAIDFIMGGCKTLEKLIPALKNNINTILSTF